jgi:hypothetical protein
MLSMLTNIFFIMYLNHLGAGKKLDISHGRHQRTG